MDSAKTWRGAALLIALASTWATAGAAPALVTSAASSATVTATTDAASARAPAGTTAVAAHNGADNAAAGDAELDNARGGNGSTIVDTRIAGQVSGNSASNVQTGWNVIDGGAFANMTGIPIVIQNSGANVLIQNATVIHLQLQ